MAPKLWTNTSFEGHWPVPTAAVIIAKGGEMLHFLKAWIVFLDMYRLGFYPSRNTHTDKNGDYWGFFRINRVDNFALYDIDFNFEFKKDIAYYHGRGPDTRVDLKTLKRKNGGKK